jgi:glycosyltransferase involved in cell wall biosynthesis
MCKARRVVGKGSTEEVEGWHHRSGAPSAPAEAGSAWPTVAFEATALLGARSGVGEFCAGLLGELGRRHAPIRAFAISWRRRSLLRPLLPEGIAATGRALPARPALWWWARAGWPGIELWVGPVDVVHGANFVVPPTTRAAAVVTVHDLTVLRFPELCDEVVRRTFPPLLARAVERGAWVHTPSEAVRAEVVEWLGVPEERVRAVPHGLRPSRRGRPGGQDGSGLDDELPEGWPGSLGRHPFVLALSTVEPRKNLPRLVEAVEHLVRGGRQEDLRLVVAGRDGWGSADFEAALRRFPAAAQRTLRLGWVSPEVREVLLSRASLLAYPSVYEGFGLPPLEAMAVGTPVVASDLPVHREVLGDGALLVPAEDASALAAALDAVLSDERLRSRLVTSGLAQAARYDWARSAAEMLRLWRDAASS